MCVPEGQRRTSANLLVGEMTALEALQRELADCDQQLALLLPHTPAGRMMPSPRSDLAAGDPCGAADPVHTVVGLA